MPVPAPAYGLPATSTVEPPHLNGSAEGVWLAMAYVKDQWTRAVKRPDGTAERFRTAKWGRGKRWLAAWIDPEGQERSKAFGTKGAAERHGAAMETDRERGEYIDPNAGKVRFEEVATR